MTLHAPVPDYAAARRAMVDSQLKPQGVTDAGVLAAMGRVPRERFVPAEVQPIAYIDRALPLGHGRFLSACSVHGQLLTQIAPQAGEKALVVGAGTGYAAALLADIGLQVTALEQEADLLAIGQAESVAIVQGDLEAGYPATGPYDVILIDGAVDYIPDAITDQLAPGGRLGTALSERGVTRLIVGRKAGGAFGYLSINDAGVPALPGFRRHHSFTF
ncbi:protein-L-isoaspartate O-methyltransferase [Sphingomonas piscis]|uniref:Protein-L-isoaspartate O-methyltransferase n=1 Tax=Sphingomonas piscis TaxID=2714943 RepID=A0A6G7YMP3_9SPHN|nr:protein-L-isoaspartate O-methyltransferase [Sphingomonas piscis]QIK78013.1 protein-L-isoaspartate O-methyltransferase [Sphingomonas piscis]